MLLLILGAAVVVVVAWSSPGMTATFRNGAAPRALPGRAVPDGVGAQLATPTPAATSRTSTPPPSQRELAARYAGKITPFLDAESKAMDDFVTTCDPADLATCRAGVQGIHDANANLEKTLKANEAPACLKEADTELHAATSHIDQGMHSGLAGIDQQDPVQIAKMVEQMDQATEHLTRAGDLLDHNTC